MRAPAVRVGALPDTARVGAGLVLIAGSAYVVLALAGHALAPRQFAALGSVYLLVSILGPGLFVAVEQQVNREVSGAVAAGTGWAPVVRSGALASVGLATLTTAGVAALSPVLVPQAFDGSWALALGTVVAVWGAAAGYVLRGVFAGRRAYGWYGGCMAVEGVARTAAGLALVGLGSRDTGWYGLVFGFGLLVSALVALAGPRRGDPGPRSPVRRMTGQVGLLAGASGLTLVLANLAPVVLTARLTSPGGADPDAAALAASFVALFVLARVPVLLVAPAQAVLLPRMTAAAARGDRVALARQARAAVAAVLLVGLPGIGLAWLLGPAAAQVLFAAPLRPSGALAALLGVGTVGMMAAQVLQPALVALGRNRSATIAWGVGTAVFALLLVLPVAPLTAAVTAQVAGPVVVTALMAAALRRALAPGQAYTATTSSTSQSTAST